MNCSFQMDTGAYALGILAPPDQTRMRLHLKCCPSCRSDVAEFSEMLRPLRSITARPNPDRERDGPVTGSEPANPG